MFCAKCGASVAEGAAFCNACGAPVAGAGIEPVVASPAGAAPATYVPVMALPGVVYAGFWLRLVAYLIDSILVAIVFGAFLAIAILALGGGPFLDSLKNADNPDQLFPLLFASWFIVLVPIVIVLPWLYFAKMESSAHQGTLGKIALGLIVADMAGRRITFGRATGRYFAKIITGLIPLGIGYIMAGFTEKKQALHDMIAACLVLRRL
jgi:uncharacterized RDD family membrane protein YckC